MATVEEGQGGEPGFIADLVRGYREFRSKAFRDYEELFRTLARKGQKPKALVVACCDSRVDPALITGAYPGDLFVVRNVANLVPPYEPDGRRHGTSAALEFAVKSLQVAHIIVLGHSNCGGVAALYRMHAEGVRAGEFIPEWMAIADSACAETAAAERQRPRFDPLPEIERRVVRVSLDNLGTFPWIAERIRERNLSLHGWYFEIETGAISAFDPRASAFVAL